MKPACTQAREAKRSPEYETLAAAICLLACVAALLVGEFIQLLYR